MCTAATYQTKDFYFGRTLDYEFSYGEKIVIMPRNFPLLFRTKGTLKHHYAMFGIAHVTDNYPLFYDASNEMGLAMAGLNFVGNAVYRKETKGKDNIATYEFIPWILSQCATVDEAKKLLNKINITAAVFRKDLPTAQLHWILADRNACITVESVENGIQIYDNPAGILTNNPPFDEQMFQLNNYMSLSPKSPQNLFSDRLPLHVYSRGMGALGLPGDLSSQSRFIRAAFVRLNSVSGDSENESVSQFFHILNSVDQQRGCCELENGTYEITIYTSCCNVSKGIYYYTSYDNHQISCVHLFHEALDEIALVTYPLVTDEQIRVQN
ncbi:MAG: choloylglycine hydrolase family protein [Eubacterium sp.]|nr:choloylglycine hydrolase family protein [Eubacterium sp.]